MGSCGHINCVWGCKEYYPLSQSGGPIPASNVTSDEGKKLIDKIFKKKSKYKLNMTYKKNKPIVIADELIKEIKARKKQGIKTYGKPLTPFNGRSALQDLLEELLDACHYIKQKIIEEEIRNKESMIPEVYNKKKKRKK